MRQAMLDRLPDTGHDAGQLRQHPVEFAPHRSLLPGLHADIDFRCRWRFGMGIPFGASGAPRHCSDSWHRRDPGFDAAHQALALQQ